MRNVTISLDEETARWVRVEAAEHDTSVSRYVGDLLRERMQQEAEYRAAMEDFLSRGPYLMRAPGEPLPPRDQLHERDE